MLLCQMKRISFFIKCNLTMTSKRTVYHVDIGIPVQTSRDMDTYLPIHSSQEEQASSDYKSSQNRTNKSWCFIGVLNGIISLLATLGLVAVYNMCNKARAENKPSLSTIEVLLLMTTIVLILSFYHRSFLYLAISRKQLALYALGNFVSLSQHSKNMCIFLFCHI